MNPSSHVLEENYPKINKICTILRSILKEDSHNRVTKLIENGYESLFIQMICQICKLFGCRNGTMIPKTDKNSMD